jgi:iron complex transport system substrate-binding protein
MLGGRKRSRTLLVLTSLALAGIATGIGCRRMDPAAGRASDGGSGGARHRIVCLTPSSTELVAAVGATDEIVGVDRYSSYPPEVLHVTRVGDFLSPNLEGILALAPDIAVLDATQDKVGAKLQAAGITTVSLPMHTLEDVRSGLLAVGRALGREREAQAAVARLDGDVAAARERAKARAADGPRPRVLVIVDRQGRGLGGLVGAGPSTFIDELLAILHADNALARAPSPYPQLSTENVISLAPDVIVDAAHTMDAVRARGDWDILTSVPAVARGRVHVVADGTLLSPSPRAGQTLARLFPLVWP